MVEARLTGVVEFLSRLCAVFESISPPLLQISFINSACQGRSTVFSPFLSSLKIMVFRCSPFLLAWVCVLSDARFPPCMFPGFDEVYAVDLLVEEEVGGVAEVEGLFEGV